MSQPRAEAVATYALPAGTRQGKPGLLRRQPGNLLSSSERRSHVLWQHALTLPEGSPGVCSGPGQCGKAASLLPRWFSPAGFPLLTTPLQASHCLPSTWYNLAKAAAHSHLHLVTVDSEHNQDPTFLEAGSINEWSVWC